jgi:hypothetical protein
LLGREQRKWNNPSRNELELEGSDGSLREFEERLQKAIDDTLALLGPNGKHKFCLRLKDEFNLELTRLAGDPETLSSVLDQTLGPAGQVVGRAIARKVAATYSIDLREGHGRTYADHIRNLRQIVSRNCALQNRTERVEIGTRVDEGAVSIRR